MKRVTKKVTAWSARLALALAALVMLPCFAFAASVSGGYVLGISPNASTGSLDNADISLTVRYELEENAGFVDGAMVSLYKVADVLPDGTLKPVEELADLPISWDVATAADVRILADTIEAYLVYSDALRGVPYEAGDAAAGDSSELALLGPVDVAFTDANGVGSFPCESDDIAAGCYLIMATSEAGDSDFVEASPSILALPYSYESGEVDYSPIVSLKVRSFSLSRAVTVDVTKVWEVGEGSTAEVEAAARPSEVTALLLCDGVIYDSAKLSEANGWQHSWDGLPAGHQWNVVEEEVPEGYTVSLVEDGTSVTIVNNCVLEPEEPVEAEKPGVDKPQDADKKPSQKLPQTGQLWWPIPVLLVLGVVFISVGIAGRRNRG